MAINHSDDNAKEGTALKRRDLLLSGSALALSAISPSVVSSARAQPAIRPGQRPNILFIMGDDVGWFNIGAYHRGMMSA